MQNHLQKSPSWQPSAWLILTAHLLAQQKRKPALALFRKETETGEVLDYAILLEDATPEEIAHGFIVYPEEPPCSR